MVYEVKNFDHLLGLTGFSDTLLKNHFTLYQGYVTNTNKLADLISAMVKEEKVSTPEFAELKRRFGWEFNGMRLHELYFSNVAKNGKALSAGSALMKKIVADFGSYELWEKEMRAITAMRGIGWGIVYYDISTGKIFNTWVNEHDVGHLSTCAPILVIDVFEHAYITDYGIKRADYLEALFTVLNWEEASKRLELVSGH